MSNGKLASRHLAFRAGALTLLALACGVAVAQPQAPAGGQPSAAPNSQVEEITVRGRRTLAVVQDEAGRATEAFYTKLSDAIDDKEYQVKCEWETGEQSLIRRRVCRAGWQADLLAEAAKAAYDETAFDPTAKYFEKQRIFNEKMLTAINSDPELIAAVRRLHALQDEIAALNGSRSDPSRAPTNAAPSN